jgi:hypothetical protein
VEVEPQAVLVVQQLQVMVAVAPNHQALVSIQVQELWSELAEPQLNMAAVEMVTTPILQEPQDLGRVLFQQLQKQTVAVAVHKCQALAVQVVLVL